MSISCDFLVIGTGLAGLSFALRAAEHGHVILLAKGRAEQTNTAMAQGGIAAVFGSDDSFASHIKDTLNAGAGLCHPEIVEMVVHSAPGAIDQLLSWGVKFDSTNTSPALTREGGHSHRRILHVQDHTGAAIHDCLLGLAKTHANIEIREDELAVDLILNREFERFSVAPVRCMGVHAISKNTQMTYDIFARFTVLATGGAGKAYLYTSNWKSATGDGIAMAYRAGASVANMEFMQFHPTCLYHNQARNNLISEALRGEGAILLDHQQQPFAKKYHPLGELAPRDIVARSIDAEMKKTGASCVFLDISSKSGDYIRERFPVIYQTCLSYGIDMTKQPIPVVPAAHYLCGGVVTDQNGQSEVDGLFVLGESSCTGLHGANRLASNSLLECLVFSKRCADWVVQHKKDFAIPQLRTSNWANQRQQTEDEMIVIAHIWDEIRTLMWNYVGIVRSNRRLNRALSRLENINSELMEYSLRIPSHPDLVELKNVALIAKLTVQSALLRQESRGIHYNIDFPEQDSAKPVRDTVISRNFDSDFILFRS